MDEKELREKIRNIVLGDTPDHFFSDNMLQKPDRIMALIASYSREAVKDALDVIAQNEGWEDSRDYYAAKFGLPYKYVDKFHKPLEALGGKDNGKP